MNDKEHNIVQIVLRVMDTSCKLVSIISRILQKSACCHTDVESTDAS